MSRKVSARIASVALFVHGFVELIGAVALLALPREFLNAKGYVGEEGEIAFSIVLAAIFGLSRLAAGYITWSIKRWGITFSVALGVTTMIAAPLMHLLGAIALSSVVMDLVLAITAVAFSFYALFGNEAIASIKS